MTIFGTDMSHYDAAPSNLGARLVSEGFEFVTHKAGGDANDAELNAWWNAVKGQRGPLLLGAYWVLYPGSATSRADAFLSRLDAQCPGWRNGPFVLQVDCEKWNNDSSTVPSKSDIKAFCDRLKAKMPKLRPIVYGPQWVYGNTLDGLGYPLWASAYVGGSGTAAALYPGDSSSKWGSYSGQTPAVLQFTSSATIAGQTTCDANAYRGTLAQLTNLIAPGWTVEVADMPLVKADADVVWGDDIIPNPDQRTDAPGHTPPGTNVTTGAAFAVGDMWQRVYDLRDMLAALADKVDALTGRPPVDVDVDALAAALAPKIDGMTESEIKDAVKDALREGTGPTA